MAIYDGFFDAVYNEETGEYDRAYNSDDFTQYFSEIIGSGVCVYENENSMLVTSSGSNAVVAPGYLFIQGYWLKNDANYTVPLTTFGVYAIVAYLNTASRRVDIEARAKVTPEVYPNCLVLAYVTVSSLGTLTVSDTRYNTSLCGVIDPLGEISDKVAWAIHYIDTEIETKLQEIEQGITAQSEELNAEIRRVSAEVEKLEPPPIGAIKFSASQNITRNWLHCDGSFISENDYPELVEALGKLTPSGDKFRLISDGEIGSQITNGVLYNGRLWVYSYEQRKLYGVDVEGSEPVKEIAISSEDYRFERLQSPIGTKPIALSIIPHKIGTGAKLFLAQVTAYNSFCSVSSVGDDYIAYIPGCFLSFSSEFTGDESNISVSIVFENVKLTKEEKYYPACFSSDKYVPYFISDTLSTGKERYMCFAASRETDIEQESMASQTSYECALAWIPGDEDNFYFLEYNYKYGSSDWMYISRTKLGFNHNNRDESIFPIHSYYTKNGYATTYNIVYSRIKSIYYKVVEDGSSPKESRASRLPMAVAGTTGVLFDIRTDGAMFFNLQTGKIIKLNYGVNLPSPARVFYDAGLYLENKDVYMLFVGTGILSFREFADGKIGYLDTTSVLGTITQFGHIEKDENNNTIYIMGQDSANNVKVAKMELNTLYDYANDGAWLPMIASDGVPAYIKAKEET